AGLIVIDFIDMDESRNNRTVERRLKEALKHDRARIQVGRISHFGLLEMSRQRIRTSVLESSTEKCPICGGSGHVRSVSSVALHLLRAVEEMLIKGATHNLIVRTRSEVALYVLNHKRAHLRELEERFRITLTVCADDEVPGQQAYLIERGEQVHSVEDARNLAQAAAQAVGTLALEGERSFESEAEEEGEADAEAETEEAQGESEQDGRRRRRRRGRGRGRGETREDAEQPFTHETVAEHAIAHEGHDAGSPEENGFDHEAEHAVHAGGEGEDRESHRRRRRGRRGGRRNRRGREGHNGHESHHANGHGETGGGFQPVGEHAEQTAAPEIQEHGGQVGENAVPAFVHETTPQEPAFERPSNPPTAEAEYPAPAAQPWSEPAAAGTQASASEEAPRRRSTVREPAPITGEGVMAPPPSPTPASTPVISVSSGEETAPPKRGWWAKRLLGNKG
ncbi:MAG TPA: ribonuclease E/G, partial [Pseudolabrys sp.]|nr:ribonuclease E/G [Pseudolabrys sp.]